MLKYITIFSIISFCYSMLGTHLHSEVKNLILIQRAPVTAYRVLERDLQIEGRNPEEVDAFMIEHAVPLMSTDPKRWIIDGLVTLDSSDRYLVNCTDSLGNARLHDPDLSADFKNRLKTYWPSSTGATEEKIWGTSYNLFGSCINSSSSAYFNNAMSMHDAYDIGKILEGAAIVPGDRYMPGNIMNAFRRRLRVKPCFTCEQFENPRNPRLPDQYLVDVYLYFNSDYQLIDCNDYYVQVCDRSVNIVYPKWRDNNQRPL